MPAARALTLVVSCLIAAAQTHAADEPEKKQKGASKVERTVEKAGASLGKTADRLEKSVKKGLAATEKAFDTAGKKTGQWLNEKTK
jgi:hypothetical protein